MVLHNLPLKEDMDEYHTIYRCIIHVFNNYPQLVSGLKLIDYYNWDKPKQAPHLGRKF